MSSHHVAETRSAEFRASSPEKGAERPRAEKPRPGVRSRLAGTAHRTGLSRLRRGADESRHIPDPPRGPPEGPGGAHGPSGSRSVEEGVVGEGTQALRAPGCTLLIACCAPRRRGPDGYDPAACRSRNDVCFRTDNFCFRRSCGRSVRGRVAAADYPKATCGFDFICVMSNTKALVDGQLNETRRSSAPWPD